MRDDGHTKFPGERAQLLVTCSTGQAPLPVRPSDHIYALKYLKEITATDTHSFDILQPRHFLDASLWPNARTWQASQVQCTQFLLPRELESNRETRDIRKEL